MSNCVKARLSGLEWLLRPLLDGRKAGAGAARSPAEDGAATASSPRLVIRGESTSPPVWSIGSLTHEDAWAP
jgi:hypothetical protein